jgi:hypothetical protein
VVAAACRVRGKSKLPHATSPFTKNAGEPRSDADHQRTEYGGIKSDQARRPKDLERENARLKRLLAEAELDKAIPREAAGPNVRARVGVGGRRSIAWSISCE